MIQWDLIPTIVVALVITHWVNYIVRMLVLQPLIKNKKANDQMMMIAEQLKKQSEEEKK